MSRRLLTCLLICTAVSAAIWATPQDSVRERTTELLFMSPADPAFARKMGELSVICRTLSDVQQLPDIKRLLQLVEDERLKGDTSGLASAICRLGSLEECRQLLEDSAKATPGDPKNAFLQDFYSRALVRHEVRRMGAVKRRPLTQPLAADLELPVHLAHAAPDLQQAWWTYKEAQREYEEALQQFSAEGHRSYLYEPEAFHQAVEDYLLGQRPTVIEEVAPFVWGSTCGNGSGPFVDSRNSVILVALLQEGNYQAALGLLPLMLREEDLIGDENGHSWPQDLAALAGTGWEQLAIGAALEYGSEFYLGLLAKFGSEEAGLALAHMLQLDDLDRYSFSKVFLIDSAAIFVAPGPDAPPPPERERPLAKRPASEQVQAEILQSFSQLVISKSAYKGLAAVALSKLVRPESKEALRSACRIPDHQIQRMAVRALQLLGEEPPPLPSALPVLMHYRVDGRSLARTEVRFACGSKDKPYQLQLQTGADGVLRVAQTFFKLCTSLDRQFVSSPFDDLHKFDDVWFEVRHAAPSNLEESGTVDVVTASLSVDIQTDDLKQPLSRGPAKVALSALMKTSSAGFVSAGSFRQISQGLKVDPSEPILFSRLGPGIYKVALSLTGAAGWESPPIDLSQGSQRLKAVLQPGADLRLSIQAPGDELSRDAMVLGRLSGPAEAALPSDPTVLSPSRSFAGLPLGSYRLEILSSAEKAQWLKNRKHLANVILTHPDSPSYQSRTISVELTGEEPLIDLGVIQLEEPVQKEP